MWKKGIIIAAARSHKAVPSDTEFHCKDQAHKCLHILHCQLWVLSRICHCFPDAPYFSQSLETFGNYKRLSFHLQETKWKQSPEKKAVFVDLKFEICSVYPKPEGKWKQQKCIFFLCFRNSHSLGEIQFLLGGWIRLSVSVWAPAPHWWHEVSWLGQSPDLCAGEVTPRDISRLCTSLMAELRRESRS